MTVSRQHEHCLLQGSLFILEQMSFTNVSTPSPSSPKISGSKWEGLDLCLGFRKWRAEWWPLFLWWLQQQYIHHCHQQHYVAWKSSRLPGAVSIHNGNSFHRRGHRGLGEGFGVVWPSETFVHQNERDVCLGTTVVHLGINNNKFRTKSSDKLDFESSCTSSSPVPPPLLPLIPNFWDTKTKIWAALIAVSLPCLFGG